MNWGSILARPLGGGGTRSRLVRALIDPAAAFVMALVVGGIGIAVFSGLVPGHPAFDYHLPFAAYGALIGAWRASTA